ncbi:MAG: glycosyltransferase family 2 protein [Steroidobacteraceae bacterium]|jgi:glycosyltransferase involved in cell wall biosynthesis|nr:glycosyltransferase family 2 protein [Steroidobacteraceae bacterium]
MNARSPFLSVVIPCYDAAPFLAEALASVFAQGLDDVEVIVVDDGSTDGSGEIARRYDPRVVLLSQPNAGIAAARNAGVARARSPWLAFLDADDLWTEGSLRSRLDAVQAVPGADGVFGALQQFLCPRLEPAAAARIDYDPTPQVARFAGTLLLRREAFLRAGPFDASLKVGEMLDWVSRAELAGLTLATLERVVMRRRIHGSNTVLRQPAAAGNADYLRALKAAIDRKRALARAAGDVREAV